MIGVDSVGVIGKDNVVKGNGLKIFSQIFCLIFFSKKY